MKQKYYSMAPDISAGGTTINDVGKQTYSRKRFNLWSFLLCLMAMVLPVGAWGQDGTDSDRPLTGDIGYIEINQSGTYYLQNITSTNQRSRIKINADNVILSIAGYNSLQAQKSSSIGTIDNPLAAIKIENNVNNFTIKYWEGTQENTNKDLSVLDLEAHNADIANNTRPAIETNGNTNVIIEGPIAVYAKSKDRSAGAEAQGASIKMQQATVKLQNGAYFNYDKPDLTGSLDRFSNPSNWEIIGFAFAGDEAYNQIQSKISKETYTEMKINAGSLYNDLAKSSLNGTAYLYGTIGNGHFVVPAKSSFNLFVHNSVNTPYGEVATNTNNVNYPFPIHTDNTADSRIKGEVNVGAAVASTTYYGQLNGQTQGDFKLNVAQYPHAGTLSASTENITLEGTKEYNKLHTVSDGFNLSASNNHILTLTGITIPANNKVYVSGDVRLGTGCSISDDVVKLRTNNNEVSVYYCQINYMNTELAKPEAEIEIENNTNNYPYAIDTYQKIIYMWLPVGDDGKNLTFKVKGSNIGYQISDNITNLHNQQHYLAAPVIYIGDVSYNTLSAAFKNVKNGETIHFDGNYTAVDGGEAKATNITTEQSFTLNLNGHTLTIGGHMGEDGGYPLISANEGKLIITGGIISGSYQIEGQVYTELADAGSVHIGNIPVKNQSVSPTITKVGDMPSVITYNINGQEVKAAKHDTDDKYCLWVPTGSETISPVKGENTIFAQIKKDGTGIYSLEPLFDLNSYDIKVETDKVTYAGNYEVSGYGDKADTPAEIVTVGQDNYNEGYTLTVSGGTYVLLKDIYESLQTGDGKVGDTDIATKLEVTGTGAANIQTSGINSIGTITIADQSTLNFNQKVETPATANALRFFSINDSKPATGTLEVESGTLLAYLNTPDGQINVATATYQSGSVRAKFADGANRFKAEDGQTDLYRVSFKVNEYYTPYDYEYSFNGETEKVTGKATSDRNGEIHLWLPVNQNTGKARFNSANQTTSSEEIEFNLVAENDNNIAPAYIGLYNGSDKSKIGSYNTLAEAFAIILANPDNNYLVGLLASHSESSTTCEISPNQNVTIDLHGHTLNCENVTFKTGAKNFMLITNSVTDEKHASITGDITVSQNVYISKNVHMDGIHVDMIVPESNPETKYEDVRRVLVKGLKFEDSYTYEYAGQKVGFTVGQKITDGPAENSGLACLWLVESMYPQEFVVYPKGNNNGKTLTVPGGELAVTAHSNGYIELVEGSVVASIGDISYKTLSAAIKAANERVGTTIELLTDIVSQATFDITNSYSINLNGHNLSFTQGGFNVKGETLTIEGTNSNLTGVINLKGNGTVKVEEEVLIGGVVMMHEDNGNIKTVYRLIVDGGSNNDASQNVWVETPERNTDIQYDVTSDQYEYTIPAGLANHSTKVTAYKVVEVKDGTNWDAVNGCNVVVKEGVTWNITTGSGTIHRLTIHEKGKVVIGDNIQITATDGIRYVRKFDEKWTLIALPFTSTDITTVIGEKVVSLSPAANPGTSGHFWLHTIKNDGTTTDVTSSEMTANEVYVMKVPTNLTGDGKAITFISGPNQMLHRNRVLNPSPISGFVAYANGTLDEVEVEKAYYILDEKGENFVRVDEPTEKVPPFSGYLLADAKTTESITTFSLRSTPTANEEIEVPADKLQIRTQPGRIILTADEPMQVVICDVAGVVKFQGEIPAGDSAYEVGAGIHIVNNQKVIVW